MLGEHPASVTVWGRVARECYCLGELPASVMGIGPRVLGMAASVREAALINVFRIPSRFGRPVRDRLKFNKLDFLLNRLKIRFFSPRAFGARRKLLF